MTDIQTGISDEVVIEEKDSGTDITQYLGRITGASHTYRDPTDQGYGIGDWKPQEIMEGQVTIEGSVTCMPPDLQPFRLIGTYTDEDGTYTITPDKKLTEMTFKQQKIDDGGVVTIDSFKFGSYTMRFGEDQDLEIEFSGQGKSFQLDTGSTIDTPSSTYDTRRFYDVKVAIDGETIGSVSSFTADFNRDLEAVRGLEDSSSRTPTEIIEKNFDHSFDIDINITDGDAYKHALNDTSSPYTVQDNKSTVDVTVTITTSSGSDEYQMTGCMVSEISSDMSDDAEKRIASIRGVATDVTIDGDI